MASPKRGGGSAVNPARNGSAEPAAEQTRG